MNIVSVYFGANTAIEDFPEPVTAAARPYDRPLKLADVARELGLPASDAEARDAGLKCSAGELASVIKVSDRLRTLGLAPLMNQDSITRNQWEKVFGHVSRELGIGIPIK